MEHALVWNHPCYSEEAHHHFARMHVPVAPRCNISCHYCNPKFDCVNESRPGVVSRLMTPEEALDKAVDFSSRMPNLTVLGIAGPGDPLANPDAVFRTFRLVRAAFPEMHLCLSTNGLMLPDYVKEIRDLGIKHVTVTVNAVNADVGERIYAHVRHEGRVFRGKEAAELLLERQLKGIAELAANGVLCKVNSVHIPGINSEHLAKVTEKVSRLGAFSHNIMPLILSPGSEFERLGQQAPLPGETARVQEASSRIMPVMRHCRQCRADAAGLLGDDVSQTPERLPARRAFSEEQKELALERLQHRAKETAAPEFSGDWSEAVRVAVATRGSGVVNQHFGHAREFLIYDVLDGQVRLVGVRKVQAYCNGKAECAEGGKAAIMEDTLELLRDCKLLLCSGIGRSPVERLQKAGIIPLIRKGDIAGNLTEGVRYWNYFTGVR